MRLPGLSGTDTLPDHRDHGHADGTGWYLLEIRDTVSNGISGNRHHAEGCDQTGGQKLTNLKNTVLQTVGNTDVQNFS